MVYYCIFITLLWSAWQLYEMLYFLIRRKDIISCEENYPDFINGTVRAGADTDMTIATASEPDCICITVLTDISWWYFILIL